MAPPKEAEGKVPPPLPKPKAGAPAASPAPPPTPAAPAPASPPRPAGSAVDPFGEGPEPRMVKGSPEEKIDYFRQVVKQKTETLTRARAMWAERNVEFDKLRDELTDTRIRAQAAEARLKEA